MPVTKLKLRNAFQRATLKAWRQTAPSFSVTAGGSPVRVSGYITRPGALLTWTQGWKSEVIAKVYQLEDGDFIDVGANVGQTLLDHRAAGVGHRYIGFEPNPAAFASLHTLLRDNVFPDCTILPLGLSDEKAVLNLYSEQSHEADVNATILSNLRPRMKTDSTAIYCCRFDELREPLGIKSIGLVKIDVEGAELAVLRGMEETLRTARVPVLCEILHADESADLEAHKAKMESAVRFLQDADYQAFRIVVDESTDRVKELVLVETFAVKVWTEQNQHECDYLLIPSEKAERFLGVFASDKARAPAQPVSSRAGLAQMA